MDVICRARVVIQVQFKRHYTSRDGSDTCPTVTYGGDVMLTIVFGC